MRVTLLAIASHPACGMFRKAVLSWSPKLSLRWWRAVGVMDLGRYPVQHYPVCPHPSQARVLMSLYPHHFRPG